MPRSTAVPRKTRPTRPLQPQFREKTRPASAKTPKSECFERAWRNTSHTGRTNMATLKPTTPLLAPNKRPLKPASPLHPKTAPKTPISPPQRRRRFQSHTDTSEQRRWRFRPPGHLACSTHTRYPRAAAPSRHQVGVAAHERVRVPVEGPRCQDFSHHCPTIPIQQQRCQYFRPNATTHRPTHTHAGPFTRTLTR